MADSAVQDKRKRRRGGNESQGGKAVDESNPTIKIFITYRSELDTKHDKYERLVKVSRDITIESKRVIFLLHRICGNEANEKDILDEADQKLKEIRGEKFKAIAEELENDDPYRYIRAYSPGLQEYIEAVSFYHYWKDGELVSLDEVKKDLEFTVPEIPSEEGTNDEIRKRNIKVHVPPMDFVLGLADLTGELMRYAINAVGNSDFDTPFKICDFIRSMHNSFVSFGNMNREVGRKINTLQASLRKVEKACYTLRVRGSEFPEHMLKDLFSSSNFGDDYGGEHSFED